MPQGCVTPADLDPRVTLHYGIPSTASILAFDRIQSLLALGTLWVNSIIDFLTILGISSFCWHQNALLFFFLFSVDNCQYLLLMLIWIRNLLTNWVGKTLRHGCWIFSFRCRDGRIKVIGGDHIEAVLTSPKQLPFKNLEVCKFKCKENIFLAFLAKLSAVRFLKNCLLCFAS